MTGVQTCALPIYDVLEGGFGNDIISGLAGDDTITGDDGDDTIDGGAGDDTISGDNGDDTIDGGIGTDMVSYANAGAGLVANLTNTAVNTGEAVGEDARIMTYPVRLDGQRILLDSSALTHRSAA